MEELPPLVPDLTAWFEALLARVSALESRSEQGGAAATAKAEAQDKALQDLQKQKEADAVAMTSMREALAEREAELAAMRQEMDSIRADLAARGAVFGGFQADVKEVRGMLVAARLLKTARDGTAASASVAGLEDERAANEQKFASREDVRILSETVRELEAMITGVERLSGEAQAQLESMRDEIAEQLRAEAEADRERVERERAEREAEAARLEAEIRAEREAREAAERERAEQEAAARDAAEQERADKEAADQEAAEQERAEKEAADQADRELAEQEAADEDAAARARAEQEAADQAARARAEKEAAARERAEREAAEAQEAAGRAQRAGARAKYARTQAKMFCTIRAMKPPDRPIPLHDKAVYHRLRDGVIEQDALAKRLAALENVVKDDAKLSADILRKGVVGLGGTGPSDEDDALVERRAAQSALMAALVDGKPTTKTETVEVAAPPAALAYGNGRGALAEFDKDIDRRFAEFACRQQKLLDDFHVEVEVFTRAQEKLENGLVKVNEDLNRMTSINDKRYAQRSAADQERDSKLEAAAASARRAAEAVARLANVPPTTSDTTLKFAEAPAAAPTDLGDVWDRIHTKADGTAVLKLREELREIAAALAGDPALTRRRKAICSGALGVRKSAYVLKDGVEVCISCQRPGSPTKRESVQFEERPKTYKSRPPMGARAKPSVGRVRPASAGPLRNSKRRGEGAFSGRMTGRPASATARLLAEGDATAEVIDLRYPVRRRDERSEADRRRAGFPSY
ncbi:unnamed protein product [Pelagomonas calceolata]|uniref:Uncharacterized protein n=1 Tax=Pelagomonas calceolata TaxID=35677 RepID=A0A8J2WW87_9STRA|nr:unnamed protein product [Pelagomonas calceolata]